MCFHPSVVIVNQYFKKKRSTAIGLAVAGSGVGTFVVAAVTTTLLDSVGWRSTLRVLAAVDFVVLVLCAVSYAPVPGLPKAAPRKLMDTVIWSDPVFKLLAGCIFVAGFGYWVPIVHLVSLAGTKGHDQADAVMLIVWLGIASTVGRVVFGKVADSFDRMKVFQLSVSVIGLSTVLVTFSNTLEQMIAYALVFGTFAGAFLATMPVLTAELMGLHNLANALGGIYSGMAITILLGPPTAGWIFEADDGDYTIAFVLSGCCMMAGNAFLWMVPCCMRSRQRDDYAVKTLRLPLMDDMEGSTMSPRSARHSGRSPSVASRSLSPQRHAANVTVPVAGATVEEHDRV
eukprot:GFYU01013426.1.p1 GENE.GFYU01013426.1~~GFYU01013426.1.p1  ORF type:complete len:383 (-),score=107.53 GFYU01013426.1:62-1093(-)